MKHPNIIVLLSDQQRWDTCGCYGQPLNMTPNLDRMAAEGVRFEKVFTCQPLCGPVRSSLQTGRYPTEIGCHVNHRKLPPDEPTLARYISAQGYDTAYIGKWHLASCGPGEGPDDYRRRPVPVERRGGYDYWLASDVLEFTSHSYDGHMFDSEGRKREFPEGRYRVDAQTDWVLEYLNTRTREKPFFLFVSYIEPHHQNDHHHHEGPIGSKERFKDFVPPGDLVNAGGNWREEYPDYLGSIHSLDENVGRIRAELAKLGLADNTVVLYASDHGSHFCTRNKEYKRSAHDASLRVPLIISGPGFEGGKTVPNLVSLIDLPPTLVRIAGAPIPPAMRGRPLQELWDGNAADWPDDVFAQISESQCGRVLRTSKWKYSVRAPGDSGGLPSSEVYVEDLLYDLEADPHEQHNLVTSPSHAAVREELAVRMKRRLAQLGESTAQIIPQEKKDEE